MGFASLYEHVRENAAQLRHIRGQADRVYRDSVETNSHLNAVAQQTRELIDEANAVFEKLDANLKLATDPDVNLAHELRQARDEGTAIQEDNKRRQRIIESQAQQIEVLQIRLNRLGNDLKKCQVENERQKSIIEEYRPHVEAADSAMASMPGVQPIADRRKRT